MKTAKYRLGLDTIYLPTCLRVGKYNVVYSPGEHFYIFALNPHVLNPYTFHTVGAGQPRNAEI